MVGALGSGLRGLGSRPGWVVVFLGNTLHLHISSSHPGVYMCICRLSGKLDELLG